MTKWQKSKSPKVPRPGPIPLPDVSLVAIDPGESTGVVAIRNGQVVRADTLDYDHFYQHLAEEWPQYPLWVVEEFAIYPWKSQQLAFNKCIPARLIGALQYRAWELCNNVTIRYQWAGSAKDAASDDLIKIYGWWPHLRTKHERDAARHALHYLINMHKEPPPNTEEWCQYDDKN